MFLIFSIVLEIGLSIVIINSRTKEQLLFDPAHAFQLTRDVENQYMPIMRTNHVNGTYKTDDQTPENVTQDTIIPNNTLVELEDLLITNHTGLRLYNISYIYHNCGGRKFVNT